MKKFLPIFIIAMLAVGIYGISSNKQKAEKINEKPREEVLEMKTEQPEPKVEQLQIEDLVVGDGQEAKEGDTVIVDYKGTLTNGTQFDSSYDRGESFSFELGAGRVIKGWDIGVAGMKIGGKRKLTIPSDLAYGDRGVPPDIPPEATLVFEVELLEIE